MHRRIKSSSLLCIMKQPDHSENHALLRNLIGKLDRKNGLRCNIQIKWTFKWIWYNLYSMSMGAAVNSKPHSMLFQQEEEGVKTVSGMLFKSLFYRTWNLSGCLLEELSGFKFMSSILSVSCVRTIRIYNRLQMHKICMLDEH